MRRQRLVESVSHAFSSCIRLEIIDPWQRGIRPLVAVEHLANSEEELPSREGLEEELLTGAVSLLRAPEPRRVEHREPGMAANESLREGAAAQPGHHQVGGQEHPEGRARARRALHVGVPPASATTSSTTESPSPAPRSGCLALKKGSKTRPRVS